MKNLSLILFSLMFLCLSCNDDDMENTPNVVNTDAQHLLDDLIWESYIGDDLAVEIGFDYIISNPLVAGDKIIYATNIRKGFIALDKDSGTEVWNNYHLLDPGFQNVAPTLADDAMHMINANRYSRIDLDNGTMLSDFRWSNPNESLSEEIDIYEENVYVSAETNVAGEVSSTWYVSAIDNVSQQSFESITTQNGIGDVGKPQFYKNENNELLLIYGSSIPTNRVTAYNLSTNQIEWQTEDFQDPTRFSGFQIDDQKLYCLAGKSIYAIDLETGQQAWGQQFLTNPVAFGSGMIQDENALYVVGTEVYFIDKTTGSLIWSAQSFEEDSGTTIAVEKNAYEPIKFENNIYYVDASTGQLISVNVNTMEFDYHMLVEPEDVSLLSDNPFSFTKSGLDVSEDGIIYSNSSRQFVAFDAPASE